MTPDPLHPLLVETLALVQQSQEHRAAAGRDKWGVVRSYPGALSNPLYSKLGCPRLRGMSIQAETITDEDVPCAKICISILLLELSKTIGAAPNAVLSVLGTVGKYGSWGTCTSSEDGAYALAATLTFYVGFYTEPDELCHAVTKDVCRILEGWLGLDTNDGVPNISRVCQAMFGSGWCGLMLSEETLMGGSEDWSTPSLTFALIKRERPPFLPGLCVAQPSISYQDLPEIEVIG
jgi:hypothetical protein